MNEEVIKKVELSVQQIIKIMKTNGLRLSEASAAIGSVFGYLATQTEENFTFVSFMNSFTRTYSINYNGEEIHELAEAKIVPTKDKKE